MTHTVLIVDNDPTQRRILRSTTEREGFIAKTADTGERAIEIITRENVQIDVVLLDLALPGMTGIETLEAAKAFKPNLPIIVVSSQGGVQIVVNAMRAGADDFLVKPASPERIGLGLRSALQIRQFSPEQKSKAATSTDQLNTFDNMIASGPGMTQVVALGKRAAKSNIPALITGESGVGKELVARAIQAASARSSRPFVTVNCGAIPENLVESTLFGHKRGSFTGAAADHAGKFKEADGGTLFLDEVGELPLDMQVKLLRALQEGEIDPVGAKRAVKVDVRIISATNKDLSALVATGAFREDLFYRLNVFPIEVPPLRHRAADIPALVDHFIDRFNAQESREVKGCLPDTLQLLNAYDWPGNVRQLENAVFRAVILAEGDYLAPSDFPHLLSAVDTAPNPPSAAPTEHDSVANLPRVQHFPVDVFDDAGHLRPLEQIERDLIQYAIDAYSGHMSEVARRLGIGRSTLYRKVREHDLDVRHARAAS